MPKTVRLTAIGLSVGVHLVIFWALYAYTPKATLISDSATITLPIQLNLLPRDTTILESPAESPSAAPIQTTSEPEVTASPNELAESDIPSESNDAIHEEIAVETQAESEPRKAIVLPSLNNIRSIVDENTNRYLQQPCEQEDGVKKHFYDCENTENEREYEMAGKTLVAEYYQDQRSSGLNKSVNRMDGLFTDFTASGNGDQLQHQINSRDATYRMMMRVLGYP